MESSSRALPWRYASELCDKRREFFRVKTALRANTRAKIDSERLHYVHCLRNIGSVKSPGSPPPGGSTADPLPPLPAAGGVGSEVRARRGR